MIEPLLPEPGRRSGRWRDHRRVINGIMWKLRTGAPWRDLPERYGSWKICHERLRRWTADGTWGAILARAQAYDDGQPVEWVISVDSSVVRAHQHAAGTRKNGEPAGGIAIPPHDGETLGRSRGGLTTKIHLAAAGRGRPRRRPDHLDAGRGEHRVDGDGELGIAVPHQKPQRVGSLIEVQQQVRACWATHAPVR